MEITGLATASATIDPKTITPETGSTNSDQFELKLEKCPTTRLTLTAKNDITTATKDFTLIIKLKSVSYKTSGEAIEISSNSLHDSKSQYSIKPTAFPDANKILATSSTPTTFAVSRAFAAAGSVDLKDASAGQSVALIKSDQATCSEAAVTSAGSTKVQILEKG